MSQEVSSALAVIVPLAIIAGIIIKPNIALIIIGVLSIIAGAFGFAFHSLLFQSLGFASITAGIAFIGFGRLIGFVEELRNERVPQRG